MAKCFALIEDTCVPKDETGVVVGLERPIKRQQLTAQDTSTIGSAYEVRKW